MKLINLEMDPTVFKSGVFLAKFGHKFSFPYLLNLIICGSVEKKIARTFCFMHQGIFRLNYVFNNHAYFFRFSHTKIPFDHF